MAKAVAQKQAPGNLKVEHPVNLNPESTLFMYRILLALAFITLPATSFGMFKQPTIQTAIAAQIQKLQASPDLAAQHRAHIQEHCATNDAAAAYIQKVLFTMITTNFTAMSALTLCDIQAAELHAPIAQAIEEELAKEE